MTCESVGIRRTALDRLVVGGAVGAVVEAGVVGGRVVGGALVDGAVIGGPAVVGVVAGAVAGAVVRGVVVEGDVELVVATAEVAVFDEEGLGSPVDVVALSLSVLHAKSATASVATPRRRATVLEDRAVHLTTEP
jgi:hypothetical protein